MATLSLTINTSLGTSTKTLTFSAQDASRIFTAWKAQTNNSQGTQDQLVQALAKLIQAQINNWVVQFETAPPPTPPVMS